MLPHLPALDLYWYTHESLLAFYFMGCHYSNLSELED